MASSSGNKVLRLIRADDESESTVYESGTLSGAGPWMVRVKIAGQTVDAWADGAQYVTSQTVIGTTYADGGYGFHAPEQNSG